MRHGVIPDDSFGSLTDENSKSWTTINISCMHIIRAQSAIDAPEAVVKEICDAINAMDKLNDALGNFPRALRSEVDQEWSRRNGLDFMAYVRKAMQLDVPLEEVLPNGSFEELAAMEYSGPKFTCDLQARLNFLSEIFGSYQKHLETKAIRKKGRKPDRQADAVAEASCEVYVQITGKKPTYWNEGSTPFSSFVSDVFRVMGIKTGIRKPIEKAIARHNSNKNS